MNDIEGLICSQLRGSRPAWPGTLSNEEFTRLAEFHGVDGLLHLSELGQWPLEVRQSVRTVALQQSMWELGHHRAAGIGLEALDCAGLQPLLMKGTALAYSHYPVASARARGDTDILVQDGAGDSAKAALERAGFSWVPSTGGSQATFVKEVCGVFHSIDVHWRFNNSPFLARLFSHADLRARAGALPAFGPRAQAVSAVDALLIACTHRLTHERNAYHVAGVSHFSADRLIWLFDIHLLANALTETEWRELRQLAADRGLRAICADGLRSAHARFGTARVPESLAGLAPTAATEAPARYFAAGSLRQWFMDLGASGDSFAKAGYLRELVFPSREYMRARFGAQRRWTLPLWYIRRSVAGAARRLARVIKS